MYISYSCNNKRYLILKSRTCCEIISIPCMGLNSLFRHYYLHKSRAINQSPFNICFVIMGTSLLPSIYSVSGTLWWLNGRLPCLRTSGIPPYLRWNVLYSRARQAAAGNVPIGIAYHTNFAHFSCFVVFVVVMYDLFLTYPAGEICWHRDNLTTDSVQVQQPEGCDIPW